MMLLRKRKELSVGRLELTRQIIRDIFASQEDKFLDLEPRIDEDVLSIKDNLKQIKEFMNAFKIQFEEQKKLIEFGKAKYQELNNAILTDNGIHNLN